MTMIRAQVTVSHDSDASTVASTSQQLHDLVASAVNEMVSDKNISAEMDAKGIRTIAKNSNGPLKFTVEIEVDNNALPAMHNTPPSDMPFDAYIAQYMDTIVNDEEATFSTTVIP